MLTLQRTVGNAAATQILQRKLLDLVPQRDTKFWEEAYTQARKDREAYIAAGKKGPLTYDPSKRNKKNYYGGFDVEYDPKDQILKVTLKGVVDFQPGIRLVKDWATALEGSPATAEAAKKINKLKKGDRAAEVNKFNWSGAGGPDAGDETAFLAKFKSSVESAWQGKHAFHCTRPGWEDLGAKVEMDVQVAKLDASNKAGAPNHVKISARKVPAGHRVTEANVNRPGGAKAGPYKNQMILTSRDVDPNDSSGLWKAIPFADGSSTLTAAGKTRLTELKKELPNAPKGATVPVADVEVRAAGKDAAERKARFESIEKGLTDAGMAAGRIKFTDQGGTAQKSKDKVPQDLVWLVIGTGAKQTTAAHEAGHMLGLDDEYVNTAHAGYGAGQKTEHEPLAAKENMVGVMHATSDSIMADGNVVREQHYLTFLDALKVVSEIDRWGFGGPRSPDLPDSLKPIDDSLGGMGDAF